jgi:hypothetical protein
VSTPQSFLSRIKINLTSSLEATDGSRDLLSLGVDTTQELGLVVRELVHSLERNIERARAGVVDGGDVDGYAVVGQLPARTTVGTVEHVDGAGSANVGEPGERAKGREA